MRIQIADPSLITREKALFVEEQANKCFTFAVESRAILLSEAHTTLQWLFAVIVGGTGYLMTLLDVGPAELVRWALAIPVFVAVGIAAVEAVRLFQGALQITKMLPAGNEPRNLATDAVFIYPEPLMRLMEACLLQERIDDAVARNRNAAAAINEARWVLVSLPGAAVVAALVTICL